MDPLNDVPTRVKQLETEVEALKVELFQLKKTLNAILRRNDTSYINNYIKMK